MNYLQLLQKLEERLGYHQLPLNAAATGLRDLFEGTALHHDWMLKLVRALHAVNRCQRLTDPVHAETVLRAFAALRRETLLASGTDIDLHALMEETGNALHALFADPDAPAEPMPPAAATAEIIAFPGARRRPR